MFIEHLLYAKHHMLRLAHVLCTLGKYCPHLADELTEICRN